MLIFFFSLLTLKSIRDHLPIFRNEISNRRTFKQFYMFCFNYFKEPDQKSLQMDVALPTWKLLLKDRYTDIDKWCEFYETRIKKSVSKDLWTLFFDFALDIGANVNKYDENGAWPIAIDEFVVYLKNEK